MNEAEKLNNQQGNGVLPCVTNRYFHELEQTEIDTLIADKKTVGYIKQGKRWQK